MEAYPVGFNGMVSKIAIFNIMPIAFSFYLTIKYRSQLIFFGIFVLDKLYHHEAKHKSIFFFMTKLLLVSKVKMSFLGFKTQLMKFRRHRTASDRTQID